MDNLKYFYANNKHEEEQIDRIIDDYPVRVTPYLAKLMEESEAIRKQYLPSIQELTTSGVPDPFEEGKNCIKTYGLERVYRDRVLLTPHFDCPAYCRFCYKKSRVMRNSPEMTFEQIDLAAEEISKMKEVRGVLITGGDSFLNTKKLFYALDKIIKLPNISEIRIGTRTLLTHPEIYSDELCDKLVSYIKVDSTNPKNSKSLAINVHFNHPDELAPEVIEATNRLISRGILLRNQTVLLKGVNDNTETIKYLFELLLRNRIIPYYLNHCMPVEGSDHFRCSVQKGIDIYKYLSTESSTIIPHYVYAPAAGKVHVGVDTVLDIVEEEEGKQIIKTKMLYKESEFLKNTRKESLPKNHESDEDGNILGWYLDGNDE